MLRPATHADLKEIASWIETKEDCERWAGWRVAFPIDLETLPSAIQFSEANGFSLIDDSGELVAFGQLLRKNGSRGHLGRLIVKPDQRGRGRGEALVQSLLENARRQSYQRVSLNVDRANSAAIALYLKMGFADSTRPDGEPAAENSRYMEIGDKS
jgi:ribosomal protein S18 acetylase RimI-like enzyme